MNKVLVQWNSLDAESAAREILPCCGSKAWAVELASKRPIADETSLIEASNAGWLALPAEAWREAFDSHPRIGQRNAQSHATEKSLQWSAQEQRTALSNDDTVALSLEDANRRYEHKFGHIFIVCASGKTSAEILAILETRMKNDTTTELREAVEQQRQITQLRLHHWLESS
jgi:2-oxo-4-hydroxy-4-carboxy-5-ureidoimidazoline decarboxylase